ncbi:MAG TPA: beta-propeller fold lactonase family protein [Terriglobia bacterium]|nr:beta-propeller fold lactonase family protein [Terriglobia bacterium]
MYLRKILAGGRNAFLFGVVAVLALAAGSTRGSAQGNSSNRTGNVYVMTNQTAGNGIMAFNRAPNGSLRMVGTFSTGGLGFGSGNDPLGSQGSLLLSDDGHFLFAVNAGSDDISVMQAGTSGLKLVGTFPSGGTEPTSLALYKDLLYVLNAGGTPNITGFQLNPNGTLTMLAGSSRPLAGGTAAAPAQVGFTPDGSFLVVTEKGTNLIDTYQVLPSGLANGPVSNTSNGATPFGFAFGRSSTLVVSEAGGGAGGTSAASSYLISMPSGTLMTVTPSVGDTQMAACWAVATNDGRFVYLSNSASGTLSSYKVGSGGQLMLLDATSGTTGSGTVPIDMAITANSQFLYALDDGTGAVSAFLIGSDGSLTALSGASGLPSGAQGIAAR